MATCASKAMSNVTPVCWEPRTMMRVVIKTVNYDGTKVPFAVTRILRAAKIVSICRQMLNVAKHNMQHANKKHVAPVVMQSVRNHRQWLTAQYVKSVDSVGMESVCHTVKRKDYKVVCVTLYRMHAKGKKFEKRKHRTV